MQSLRSDFDQDGDLDLIMGGNLHRVKPEVGRYDASYGNVLENDGKGNYTDKTLEFGFLCPRRNQRYHHRR